jgi:hypothetical protein
MVGDIQQGGALFVYDIPCPTLLLRPALTNDLTPERSNHVMIRLTHSIATRGSYTVNVINDESFKFTGISSLRLFPRSDFLASDERTWIAGGKRERILGISKMGLSGERLLPELTLVRRGSGLATMSESRASYPVLILLYVQQTDNRKERLHGCPTVRHKG